MEDSEKNEAETEDSVSNSEEQNAQELLDLQNTNEVLRHEAENLREALQKTQIELSTANTEVRNLKQENDLLRANLREYQKELDEVEISQTIYRNPTSPTPEKSPRFFHKRKSNKKIKKKDISGPNTDTVVHITGAKMINSEITVIDNSGLLDPRVRKFLALAGIDGTNLKEDPEKLKLVEQVVQEENVVEKMKRREELRSKTKEKAVSLAAPPPPPPLPPPPPSGAAGDPKPLLKIEKRNSVVEAPSSAGGVEIQMKDIASGRAALRRVTSADKNKVKVEVLSDGELLTAFKEALQKINDGVGYSSDEDSDLEEW